MFNVLLRSRSKLTNVKNLGVKLPLMRNEELTICSNHSVDLWTDV